MIAHQDIDRPTIAWLTLIRPNPFLLCAPQCVWAEQVYIDILTSTKWLGSKSIKASTLAVKSIFAKLIVITTNFAKQKLSWLTWPQFQSAAERPLLCLLCNFHFIALLTVSTQKGMLSFRCFPHKNIWRHNAIHSKCAIWQPNFSANLWNTLAL